MATPARASATADLFVSIDAVPGEHPTAGSLFHVSVGVTNKGPDPSHFRVHLLVPAGVQYAGGGLGCDGTTGDLSCSGGDGPVGDDGSATASLVAAAAGTYTLTARLTDLAATDPNLANNEASLTVDVAAHPTAVAVRGFAIVPASPRAGSTFTVSYRIVDRITNKQIVPDAAHCRVSTGRARSRVVGRRATCRVTTPASAHGKLLRGVLSTVVGQTSVSRRFTVRLR